MEIVNFAVFSSSVEVKATYIEVPRPTSVPHFPRFWETLTLLFDNLINVNSCTSLKDVENKCFFFYMTKTNA